MKEKTVVSKEFLVSAIDSIFEKNNFKPEKGMMYEIEERMDENYVRVVPVLRKENELDSLKIANELLKASINMVNSIMNENRVLGVPELNTLENSLMQAQQRLERAQELIRKRL